MLRLRHLRAPPSAQHTPWYSIRIDTSISISEYYC